MDRLVFFATVAALGATLSATAVLTRSNRCCLGTPAVELPSEIVGWKRVRDLPLDVRTLERLKPTVYFSGRYAKGGRFLDVFIAYYAEQWSGESMHSPKQCLPGSGWEIHERERTTIAADGSSPEINLYSIRRAREELRVLYWYQSGDRIIASEYVGKLLLMSDAIRGRGRDGALVRLTIEPSEEALVEGRAVASALVPFTAQLFRR
jgi:EpsI family protein